MKLGVESFTIIDDITNDLEGTLKKLSDLGFHYIEWLNRNAATVVGAGFGRSPKETLEIYDAYGMKVVGTIVSNSATFKDFYFEYDKIQRVIDWYAEAGATTFGLAIDFFQDLDFLNRRIAAYNEIGKRCKAAGLNFMYHNHPHEWAVMEGKTIFDRIVDDTDPDLVGFDLDVYWAFRGGQDPVELMKKLGSRVKSLHAKDFPASRMEFVDISGDMSKAIPADFTECGKGVLKWQDIVDTGNALGVPYMFVEQDHTSLASKYETLKDSKEYLLTLNGLSAD